MSGPVEIVARLWSWILDGSLWENLGATLLAMALGYVIGTVTGIVLGLLFGFLPRLHRVLSPYITALYAMPKIALAPLFVIMLGIGIASKVALVAITVFFLVLNSTLDGVRNVDRDLVRSLALMGATRIEVIRKVLVPATLPWIFTGMRIAVRYAFTNTLLAELIASNSGIGFLIEYYSGTFDAAGAYAAILVLVIMQRRPDRTADAGRDADGAWADASNCRSASHWNDLANIERVRHGLTIGTPVSNEVRNRCG